MPEQPLFSLPPVPWTPMYRERVGIVGSRRRCEDSDRNLVFDIVRRLVEKNPRVIIVSGGCKTGADRYAEEAAKFFGCSMLIHWPKMPPEGSSIHKYTEANYARNTLVAESSLELHALVADDRLGGTEDTIQKAHRFGRDIWLW